MRATKIYGAGDIRLEEIPDPVIEKPTDAVIDITHSCICGSDLWRYRDLAPQEEGQHMGHECIGRVREVGSEVTTVKPGDMVVAPFVVSCGFCDFCKVGLQTSCVHKERWPSGMQAEMLRVPWADGTLVKLGVDVDDARMPGLLTLSDVMGTGHHAVVAAGVTEGSTVAVVGDGAVGLSAVLSAKRAGASRIIALGRHTDRTDIAVKFGATDVVAERGDAAIEAVRDLTGGGAQYVVEAVGLQASWDTAIAITRDGGHIGYVGVPHLDGDGLAIREPFVRNIQIGGGLAPTRAYIEEYLPEVLSGAIDPGLVFDDVLSLDEVAEGYRRMRDRESLKVLLRVQ